MGEQVTSTDWKYHPIYFAAVGAVAGVAFAMQWLAPAQLGSLRYEVEDARHEVKRAKEDHEAAAARDADYEQKIKDLSKQLDDAKRVVAASQLAGLYSFGSPYPIGLAQIKIGDPRSLIEKVFPKDKIDKNAEVFWSVEDAHAHLRATYYFAESSQGTTVTQILFMAKYGSPLEDNELLRTKLVDALGRPTSSPKSGHYVWDLRGISVYFNKDGYVVGKKDSPPGSWP